MAFALQIRRLAPVSALAAAALLTGLAAGIEPAVAISAALALAFALIAIADLAIALAIYIQLVFLEPGSLGKALIAASVVLALAWIARGSLTGDQARMAAPPARHRTVTALLGMLLAWAVLSVGWAESTQEAAVDLARYGLNALLFAIVFTTLKTRRQAAWLLAGYVFGAVVVSLLGPIIRPDFLGPATEAAAEAVPTGEQIRFVGGLADPNELAAVLIPALAISIGAIAAAAEAPLLRLAAVPAAVISLAIVLLTASRGGLVGCAVALVAGVAMAGRWRPQVALGVVAVAVSTVVYFGIFAPPEVRDRIVQPTQGESRAQLSRLTLWEVGLRMFEDRPLVGVGVGNYEEAARDYVLQPGLAARSETVVDEAQPAHNTYLHLFAELGIAGGLLFSGLSAVAVACSVAAARAFRALGDTPMEVMSKALAIGQIGLLAAIFFFSAQSVNKVWLVLALGPGLLGVASAAMAARRPT